MRQDRKGFTLIELLIVIGIIGFLAAAILVAVDPVKRIQDSRNSQRWSEVNGILNAILKWQVDNRTLFEGNDLAPIIDQSGNNVQVIVEDSNGIDCTNPTARPGCFELMDDTGTKACVAQLYHATEETQSLVPRYLAEIPTDPADNACDPADPDDNCLTEGGELIGPTNSGYYIKRNPGNRIEIGACQPEQEAEIRVKR